MKVKTTGTGGIVCAKHECDVESKNGKLYCPEWKREQKIKTNKKVDKTKALETLKYVGLLSHKFVCLDIEYCYMGTITTREVGTGSINE